MALFALGPKKVSQDAKIKAKRYGTFRVRFKKRPQKGPQNGRDFFP